MLYLLDANVLIDANRDYYPLSRIPEFWEWLIHMGELDRIKVPLDTYEEVKGGNDDLAEWVKSARVKQALLFEEEAEPSLVAEIIDDGYAPDLDDNEIEKLGRDPFLIAYALKHKSSRCVVTTEVSKPSRRRANRHVPDVCNDFNVSWCHTFDLLRVLNFRTDWKNL